ncbi:MAG TPA: acetate uptake transporter [Ktedonobacteraceae bacterium]
MIAGIVELLAGMWEFRRDNTIAATVFSAYGGFAAGLGVVYLWGGTPLAGPTHLAFGLLLLIWSVFLGVLLLASMRTNHLLTVTLGLVFAFYVIVTIGQLAFDNRVLLIIGGWVGIVGTLVAWFAVLGSMTGVTNLRDNLRMPAR